MNDEEILYQFQKTRRIKNQTMKGYKDAVRIYKEINNMTLEELFKEAIDEEMDRIRWADRTLKKRLEEFRIYLYDNYAKKTANIHFGRIKTIYLHFDIEIHKLPSIKSEDKEPPITYQDLPTQIILKKALSISVPMIRALIELMVATGCAKKEVRHITFKEVLEGTYEYHHKNNLIDAVNLMKGRDDIVITFHLKRFKTGKWFYTFAHPEASSTLIDYIILLLNKYPNIQPEDKIFDINKDYFNNYFKEINNALGLGKVRSYNRFTSHMLRRYHASTLEDAGMDSETINRLQGKSRSPTDEAYFKNNPKKLKEKYMQHMHALYINFDVAEVKSEEVIRLENENELLRKQNEETNARIDNLEKIVLGNISDEKLSKLHNLL
ncbi:MAG: site-specific integrase [Methanobrevibacter sp.]|nr:site-specific integrase [Methanobrevibacter sp.]